MESLREYFSSAQWGELVTVWGMRVVGAVLILLMGLWIARVLANMVRSSLLKANVEEMLASFMRRVAYVVLLVVVLVTVLSQLGVQTTSMLAVLGAAGLAIGLALQGSLSNIAAGFMLISLRPFHVGDFVQVAGQEGLIHEVGIFQTTVKTFSNHYVTIPNRQITDSTIVNYTALGQRRVDLPVGVGYESDVRAARDVLVAVARAHEKVLDDPEPNVIVTGLGDNSVDLVLRAWVQTPDFAGVRSDLLEAVHRELGRADINIPFPQRDVHLKLPKDFRLPAANGG